MVLDAAAVGTIVSLMMNGMCCYHKIYEEEQKREEIRKNFREEYEKHRRMEREFWEQQRGISEMRHDCDDDDESVREAELERRRQLLSQKMNASLSAAGSAVSTGETGRPASSSSISIPLRDGSAGNQGSVSSSRANGSRRGSSRTQPRDEPCASSMREEQLFRTRPEHPSRSYYIERRNSSASYLYSSLQSPRPPSLVKADQKCGREQCSRSGTSSLFDTDDDDDDDDDEGEDHDEEAPFVDVNIL